MMSTTAMPGVAEATTAKRLVVAGLDFEVQLSGSRRSIGITVDRDGSLIVTAPQGCDEAELARFAHDKRMWVYKKLAEKDLLLSRRPMKEFVSGEGFAYLGRSYRLLFKEGAVDPVKLERGRLVMPRDVAASEARAQALVDWYRARALRWFPPRVRPWAERMGVSPSAIDVRDLGYRWGSLGKHDRINFHWATIQLPPALVDYVIVHELAHVHEPHHTPGFWSRVERAMPTFERSKDDLARLGSGLWLGVAEGESPNRSGSPQEDNLSGLNT
jgi:predicted metal-dependent hydrolase